MKHIYLDDVEHQKQVVCQETRAIPQLHVKALERTCLLFFVVESTRVSDSSVVGTVYPHLHSSRRQHDGGKSHAMRVSEASTYERAEDTSQCQDISRVRRRPQIDYIPSTLGIISC